MKRGKLLRLTAICLAFYGCVLAACLYGYTVFIPADCVQSRDPKNRELSLRRMEAAGAVITCAESILYELLGSSKAAEFKAISAIVK